MWFYILGFICSIIFWSYVAPTLDSPEDYLMSLWLGITVFFCWPLYVLATVGDYFIKGDNFTPITMLFSSLITVVMLLSVGIILVTMM